MKIDTSFVLSNPLFRDKNVSNIGFVVEDGSYDIVEHIMNNKLFLNTTLNSLIFDDEEHMNKYYQSNLNSLIAGIIINPNDMSYTLRVDGSSVPNNALENNNINSLLNPINSTNYLSTFTPIQMAIDQSLIHLKLNNTVDITPKFGKLPMVNGDEKVKLSYFELGYIVLIEMNFILPMILSIQFIVAENENKIKSLLISMGMHPSSFWLSWLISNTSILYLMAFLMCFICKIFNVFTFFTAITIFIFLCLYSTSVISFSFLFSTFFKDQKTAYSVADIFLTIFSLTYIPFYFSPKIIKLFISFFLSPVALGIGIEKILILNKKKFTLNEIMNIDKDIIYAFLFLIWNVIIYFLLAIFFDSYFSEENQSFISFKRKSKNVIELKEIEKKTTYDNDIEEYHGKENSFIEIKNITKQYKHLNNEFLAINNISFKAYKNEIFCLLGHNGAGKSTLVKMITGLIKPTNGKIFYDGIEFNENELFIRENMGNLTN